MASIDVSSWLAKSGSAPDNVSLAAGLYECCIHIFSCLFSTRLPPPDQHLLKRLQTQGWRFKLWGFNYGADDGTLDETLCKSDRLRNVLLSVLVRMGETLIILAERLKQEEEVATMRPRISTLGRQALVSIVEPGTREDKNDMNVYQDISLDDLSSTDSDASSDDGEMEFEELVLDLESHNSCLYGLGSVIQDPAESLYPESDTVSSERLLKIQEMFTNTAWPYINRIIAAYPSIDINFARRLGEANEWRYNSLLQNRTILADTALQNTVEPKEEVVQVLQPESSGVSAPSTKRSSIFDEQKSSSQVRKAASVTTFASSFGETGDHGPSRSLPKMPTSRPWGLPYPCTICGELLSNVWSPDQWKRHAYQDLEPYICSFNSCSQEHTTFVSRHEWAEHEFSKHRSETPKLCIECGFCSSNADQFQQHVADSHTDLSAADFERTANWISREKCPFCSSCLSDPAVTRSGFVSHVGKHMREIAHGAIPLSAWTNEDDNSDISEESSSKSSKENTVNMSHWIRKVYERPSPATMFEDTGQPSMCLGRDDPKAVERVANDYTEILKLVFVNGELRVSFCLRGHDGRARLVCQKIKPERKRKYCTIYLTSLEVDRKGSFLNFHNVGAKQRSQEPWCCLRFNSYEQLVLFFCSFLALHSQDNSQDITSTDDWELGDEEVYFDCFINDNQFRHRLRLLRDKDSGGKRIQASATGAMENMPVWTVFITHQIHSPAWMRRSGRAVLFDDFHHHIFTADYSPPAAIDGEYGLTFENQHYAATFCDAIEELAKNE